MNYYREAYHSQFNAAGMQPQGARMSGRLHNCAGALLSCAQVCNYLKFYGVVQHNYWLELKRFQIGLKHQSVLHIIDWFAITYT